MTRVLLTGAGGFVGSHVLEVLLADTEWQIAVAGTYRFNGTQDRIFEVVQHYGAWDRLDPLVHDLTTPLSPREKLQIGLPDHIINIASGCSVSQSIVEPAAFVRNNVELMLTILEQAREWWTWQGQDVRVPHHRLVHLTTDEVRGPGPCVDRSAIAHVPSSPYAASKAAQEDLARAWSHTYGIPTTLIRSANMFGERQSQLAFIPRVIRAVSEGRSIQIHTWNGEPGRRCYSYVRSVAQWLVDHLTTTDQPGVPFQPWSDFELPGQAEIDNLSLAKRVAALTGHRLQYELVEGRSVRPGYDPQYAPLKGEAAWASESFEDGLERTVKWFVDHRDWLVQ